MPGALARLAGARLLRARPRARAAEPERPTPRAWTREPAAEPVLDVLPAALEARSADHAIPPLDDGECAIDELAFVLATDHLSTADAGIDGFANFASGVGESRQPMRRSTLVCVRHRTRGVASREHRQARARI
jgi:hypothetical protein